MVLIIHILISVLSLIYSTFIAINPSNKGINNVYKLSAVSMLSGVALVLSSPQTLDKFCISGLIYLASTALLVKLSKVRISRTFSL